MKSALANFQTVPLKDAARQLHHAFQEIEIKRFIIHPSSFILFTMLGSVLSNDPLSDKCFDFQFVNPPYGYEWSKDFALRHELSWTHYRRSFATTDESWTVEQNDVVTLARYVDEHFKKMRFQS